MIFFPDQRIFQRNVISAAENAAFLLPKSVAFDCYERTKRYMHFASSNGHGSVHRRTVCVPTGQTEWHYSTVLLTWASIAYDLMAKRQGCIKWPLPWLESLSYATHVKSLSRNKVILSRLSGKPAPCPFGGANSSVRWRNMHLERESNASHLNIVNSAMVPLYKSDEKRREKYMFRNSVTSHWLLTLNMLNIPIKRW